MSGLFYKLLLRIREEMSIQFWKMRGLFYGLLLFWPGWGWGETVHVAVTASFKTPLEQLAVAFKQRTGDEILVSSASTGKLVAQIQHGAPYHLFLAADEVHPRLLLDEGLGVVGTDFVYALGRLVLFSAQPDLLKAAPGILSSKSIKRLALANPVSAPYGQAGQEVLTRLGLWSTFAGRIAYGENVGHVMTFIQSGVVQAGFVVYSQVANLHSGSLWEPPATLYTPLRHGGVVLKKGEGRVGVLALVDFLRSEEARSALVRMGFGVLP